jgi:hypothetical protein
LAVVIVLVLVAIGGSVVPARSSSGPPVGAAPTVTSTSPAISTTGGPANPPILATFDEAMDPLTITVSPRPVPSVATAPALGAAASFAVLAGTAVTCTDSVVIGDMGVYPGTAVTQTNCIIVGTIHAGDAAAAAASSDFLSAYDALALVPCDAVKTGTLDGETLAPGVYCFDAAATLTGQLTLDGPSNGVWIFRIGTSGTGALTTTNFSVVMAGGGQPCDVYWGVAEAATLTDATFVGTILAGAAITMTRGTSTGAAFAKAAVTMTGTNLTGCAGDDGDDDDGDDDDGDDGDDDDGDDDDGDDDDGEDEDG